MNKDLPGPRAPFAGPGGDAAVRTPSQSGSFIHSFRGARRPGGGEGGSPTLTVRQGSSALLPPSAFEQASPPLCWKESQEALRSCQHGFNWPKSAQSDLDSGHLPRHAIPPPPGRGPLLFFICSPPLPPPVSSQLGWVALRRPGLCSEQALTCKAGPLPKKQPLQKGHPARAKGEPSDSLHQGFIFYFRFHYPLASKDQGLSSPHPRPKSLLPPQRAFQHDGPRPKANPESSSGPARPPGLKGPADHRDSVSSWQIFAKFKGERKDPPPTPHPRPVDGWKLAICHRVEFPLIRDVPLRRGGGLPSPIPSISRTVSRSSPELRVRWTEAGGHLGSPLPQLMKSAVQTGLSGVIGQRPPSRQGPSRRRSQKYAPKVMKQFPSMRLQSGAGWGGGRYPRRPGARVLQEAERRRGTRREGPVPGPEARPDP